jgi:hypothetical protein
VMRRLLDQARPVRMPEDGRLMFVVHGTALTPSETAQWATTVHSELFDEPPVDLSWRVRLITR